MADGAKTRLMRCPVCLNGGIDVYLKREGETCRCMKCSFTGTVREAEELYDLFRKRYRWLDRRLTLEDQRKL